MPSESVVEGKALPRFHIHELQIGSYLGEGGFCVVHAVTGFRLGLSGKVSTSEKNAQENTEGKQQELRQTLASSRGLYVIKRIRSDLPDGEESKAINDLAIEAGFLMKINHKHIISMCGYSIQDPTNNDFFVILELLRETLDQKLKNKWKREVSKAEGTFWGCCCQNNDKLRDMWIERITVARDIASAIYFLHCNSIIYRDLKPDNIGFDMEGVVKLFDFGLAKSLESAKRVSGFYELTGNTGSLRYMAPEVYLDLVYDERVDAYSMGILLWQICSLTTPFAGFTRQMHAKMVIGKSVRPTIPSSWQAGLGVLMTNCWGSDCSTRPDFGRIVSALEEEIRILQTSNELSKVMPSEPLKKKFDAAVV